MDSPLDPRGRDMPALALELERKLIATSGCVCTRHVANIAQCSRLRYIQWGSRERGGTEAENKDRARTAWSSVSCRDACRRQLTVQDEASPCISRSGLPMPTGRCIDGMATVNHGQPPSPLALRGWPLVTLACYTRAV